MLLKRLSEAFGLPGQEGEVRDLIKEELKCSDIPFRTDALGNILAASAPGNNAGRVMLAAHMDEIGLMVTGFDRSGLLRIKALGGMDERVLVSKTVLVGKDRIPGVIGSKAIHLQEPDERERPLKMENLYIDIGAATKEEANACVSLGDGAIFATDFELMGSGMAKGKALDDRAGCAILVESLRRFKDMGLSISAAFTVQEEIGARGAWVASYSMEPSLAIVVECTSAADVPGTEEHECPTRVGKGAVISFMDSGQIVNPKVFKALVETAEGKGIPFQLREGTAGGTDGGRISLSKSGVPTVVISVPCRYIHSPAGIMSMADYGAAAELVAAFTERVGERGVPA